MGLFTKIFQSRDLFKKAGLSFSGNILIDEKDKNF